MRREIIHGAMREVLSREPSNSFDSCVTDPPYALTTETGQTFPGRYDANPRCSTGGFMGLAWDSDLPAIEDWREVFRVLKPGAHLLAFGGTRTYHRLASPIEQTGFEIRDMIEWCYWSGFPKSLNVSKAIDKKAGTSRGATDEAKQWNGWGTALKPAHEPIVCARKPFLGTVAENVLANGTAALNIEGCRIPFLEDKDKSATMAGAVRQRRSHDKPGEPYKGCGKTGFTNSLGSIQPCIDKMDGGRWPANVISEFGIFGADTRYTDLDAWERGQASGLFVCPKPSASERDAGLGMAGISERKTDSRERLNSHPTVKPVMLMRWLVRLVTPPGGVVLEPFAGSGTTGVAAIEENCGFLMIEREAEYIKIARARISAPRQGGLF